MSQSQNKVRTLITRFENLRGGDPQVDPVLQPEPTVLERFRSKRDAVREIDAPFLLDISENLTVIKYNALRRKLFEINGQLEDDNFQPQANVAEYKSPRNLVGILVANYGDAINRETVKKLFAIQHEFKWCTETGDPDQFSFYGFCKDVQDAGGQDVIKRDTRKAHVISRLYHAQEKLHIIRHLTHRQLCPPVYVCTENAGGDLTWTKWKWSINTLIADEQDEEVGIELISNKPLREYIKQNSKRNNSGNLPNENDHLYWAVFEEDDFDNNNPHVNVYGRTQIYVGHATSGITNRWVADSKSHCKNMEHSRNVACNMMNYDQSTLEGQQLVDLRFLLHKAYNQTGDKSWLFIMNSLPHRTAQQSESDYLEGFQVHDVPININWKPKNMLFGVNGRG